MIILQAVSISYIQTINEKDWLFASPFFYTKVKCKEDIRNPLVTCLKLRQLLKGSFRNQISMFFQMASPAREKLRPSPYSERILHTLLKSSAEQEDW